MFISAQQLSRLLTPAPEGGDPAYRQLADGLRLLILDGRLSAGAHLPSERSLAVGLAVSRTTITAAYGQLRDQGYAIARHGSGTMVTLPSSMRLSSAQHLAGPIVPGDAFDTSIDLATAAPPAPPGIAAAYRSALEALPRLLSGSGYHPLGIEPLRVAVAARYGERGLPTTPDQIIITNGALSAMSLLAGLLIRPGDRVMVENPTFPNTLEVLRSRGARLTGVPVEPAGWDVPAIIRTARTHRPHAILLTPDFNNPTGALLRAEQRAELASALNGLPLIIDETLVEFFATQEVPPPMAAYAPQAILVGSASKSHWGGFRLGWIRVPDEQTNPGLLDRLARRRLAIDLGAAPLEQAALTYLMDDPAVVDHQRSRVNMGRAAAHDAITKLLPQWRVPLPDGGCALWCELPDRTAAQISLTAEHHGVRVAAGPRFAADGGFERFIRISHVLDPGTIVTGIGRLAAAVGSPLASTSAPSRPVLA